MDVTSMKDTKNMKVSNDERPDSVTNVPSGMSAYDLAVCRGYPGTYNQWIVALVTK